MWQSVCAIVDMFDRDVEKVNVWFQTFKKAKDDDAVLENLQNISEIIWYCQSSESKYKQIIPYAQTNEEKKLYIRMRRFFYKLKRIAWNGGEYLATRDRRYLEKMSNRGKNVDNMYQRILSSKPYQTCKNS